MKTVFLTLMIVSIVVAVAGLASMIYGFVTVKNVNVNEIDRETTDTTKTRLSREIEYKKEKGIEYSYETEYEISAFWKQLRAGNPKTKKDAFIVFGIAAFVFFTFFAIGTGMIAYGNKMGWIFLVLVGAIFGYVVYEFVKRM